MNKLSYLDDKPTKKAVILFLILSIPMLIITNLIMRYYSALAGPHAAVLASQLSFSGEFLKLDYAGMINNGNLDFYRIYIISDYGFMVSYALFGFSLVLLIARRFPGNNKWRSIGFRMALLVIVATLLDVLENAFILATLSNPVGFPNWWAIAHSSLSFIKWFLGAIALIYAIVAFIVSVFQKSTNKIKKNN